MTPPPQRTAYFCRARRPGSVLRVSSTRALVPSSAATQCEVAVATPERWEAKFRAVRSAVSRPRVGPDDAHDHVAGLDAGAVGDPVGDLDVVAEHVGEDQRGDAEPGDDAGLPGAEVGRRRGRRRGSSPRW